MDSSNHDSSALYVPIRRSSTASAQSGHYSSPNQRRSSLASTTSTASSVSPGERRKLIQAIMSDSSLSQKEKSKSIQSLMDGRPRRSSEHSRASVGTASGDGSVASYVNSISQAAAAASAFYGYEHEYEDVSINGEAVNNKDDRSLTSAATIPSRRPDEYDHCQIVGQTNPTGLSYREYHGRSQSLMGWKDGSERITAAANATFCDPVTLSKLMEQSRPPCEHYVRNCSLVSPCCGLAFGCRICHDECPELPPPIATRRSSITNVPAHHSKLERRRSLPHAFQEEEETHHLIDRFAVKEIICRKCYTRQSSKT